MTLLRRGAWGRPFTVLLAPVVAAGVFAAPAHAAAPVNAPVITSPAGGTTAAGLLTVTATADPDTTEIVFMLDAVTVATAVVDGAASATLSTYGVVNGPHTLTATGCNADGCAELGAEPVELLVSNPILGTVTPTRFNPARASVTIPYTLPADATVTLSVRSAAGVVRTGPATAVLAGARRLTWDGRNDAGTVVAQGTYTIRVATSRPSPDDPNQTLTSNLEKRVYVDRYAPALTSVTGANSRVFPYVDTYRDVFVSGVTVNEPASLTLVIENSAGRRIRSIAVGRKAKGTWRAAWNGKLVSGTKVPAGTYGFRWLAVDTAGNARLTARYALTISWQKATLKSAVKKVTAGASRNATTVGSCSIVRSASDVAPGALELRSNGKEQDNVACDNTKRYFDLARTKHRLLLPKVEINRIVISARGSDRYGLGGVGTLSVRSAGGVALRNKILGSALADYTAASVGPEAVDRYSYVRWYATTQQGHSWVAQTFTVRYSWWVLS